MLEVSVKVKWEQRKIHDLNNTETMYWKPQSLRLRSWWLNTKRAHSCPTWVQPSRRKGKECEIEKNTWWENSWNSAICQNAFRLKNPNNITYLQ
jgi:hypothetical protein